MFYAYTRVEDVEVISKFPWRIGIVTFMAFPELMKQFEGIADKLKVLAEDPFFDLLEVYEVGDQDWRELEKYRGKVEFAVGLQPEVLAKGVNPNALDESERRRAVDILKAKIEVAARRGVRNVALCSGPRPEEQRVNEAKKALARSLEELASYANRYGITILLETFDIRWDRKRLAGGLAETAEIVRGVREKYGNLAVMWDLSHAPLLDETPEILREYGDLIGHIHIGCAKKIEDKLYDWHPGFYRPGALNDERDVARLLKVLYDINYRGAVSFEVKPEEGQDPREVVATAKSVLVRAYQILLEEKLGGR